MLAVGQVARWLDSIEKKKEGKTSFILSFLLLREGTLGKQNPLAESISVSKAN